MVLFQYCYGDVVIVMFQDCNGDFYDAMFRDSDPDSWARVQLLMDHDEERRKELDYWKMFQVVERMIMLRFRIMRTIRMKTFFQKNVVDYIRIRGNLADKYSDDEIHRAIGILRYILNAQASRLKFIEEIQSDNRQDQCVSS